MMEIYGVLTYLGVAVYVIGPWVPNTDETIAVCQETAERVIARAGPTHRFDLAAICGRFPQRPEIDKPFPIVEQQPQ